MSADVSTVTAAIGEAANAIATVGMAVVALLVMPHVFKWIRASIDDVPEKGEIDYSSDGDHFYVPCDACGEEYFDDVWDENGGCCPGCGVAAAEDEWIESEEELEELLDTEAADDIELQCGNCGYTMWGDELIHAYDVQHCPKCGEWFE